MRFIQASTAVDIEVKWHIANKRNLIIQTCQILMKINFNTTNCKK